MNFNDYQAKIIKFDYFSATNDPTEPAFSEKLLGLVGEAGETADKFKKIIRDQDGQITPENTAEIKKELGDILWYLASIARYLDIPLEDVAKSNIDKLESRLQRNLIHGSGDNR
ncbi:nucleoside triphosphate pyrophosphohydrolase family protein [Candidatus Saccharibacteria bacterium]|nr:nucleoside triphosphate pyrophosphohydrolase family protein [Candidatus Saccharibacteria bacterium]